MFTKAIEIASHFTRPVHTICRYYGSTTVFPGAATLFIINKEGWALTCAHVVRHLLASEELNNKYGGFKKERIALANVKRERQLLRELERKYGYSKDKTVEVRNLFVNCVEGFQGFDWRIHKSTDLALIRFLGYTRLLCDHFPVFPTDTSGLRQGKYLCRLGFPFPEFTNFSYVADSDTITWSKTGRDTTPQFPIDGMVTRHLLGDDGAILGFEMSTPGLRGQSGGPAFDGEGKVWGMQAATFHLDLDFDVSQEVIRGGNRKVITDSAFLHVGHCVHVNVIKSFMKENGVEFDEG